MILFLLILKLIDDRIIIIKETIQEGIKASNLQKKDIMIVHKLMQDFPRQMKNQIIS